MAAVEPFLELTPPTPCPKHVKRPDESDYANIWAFWSRVTDSIAFLVRSRVKKANLTKHFTVVFQADSCTQVLAKRTVCSGDKNLPERLSTCFGQIVY
jgi:hypothetical protein